MQDCARGLQLYNSVTPMLDIVTSNRCEILNAEMYAESMTFDWNTVEQASGNDAEVNDASVSDDMSDSVDDEEEPEDAGMLTNHGSLLYSTNFITSCLNSKETRIIVNRRPPVTQMTTHKRSTL